MKFYNNFYINSNNSNSNFNIRYLRKNLEIKHLKTFF